MTYSYNLLGHPILILQCISGRSSRLEEAPLKSPLLPSVDSPLSLLERYEHPPPVILIMLIITSSLVPIPERSDPTKLSNHNFLDQ